MRITTLLLVLLFSSSCYADCNVTQYATIDDAISSCPERTIVVPAGVFIVSGLTLPSHTHLRINGTIKLAPNTRKPVILIPAGTTDVLIDGIGVIDGNRSQQGDISLCLSLPICAGILSDPGASHITIRDIHVTETVLWPLNIVAASDVLIEGAEFSHAGSSAECAAGTTRCLVIGITAHDIADEGFAFYGGVTDSSITGSVAYRNGADGITVLSDVAQRAPCSRITITGNTSYDNVLSGFSVISTIPGSPQSDVTLTGNQTHGNRYGPSPSIRIANALRITMLGNQSTNEIVTPAPLFFTFKFPQMFRFP